MPQHQNFTVTQQAVHCFFANGSTLVKIWLIGGLLSSCSWLPSSEGNTNSTSDTVQAASQATASTHKKNELPSKPFAQDTLLNLLEGELAVYARDINTAAENYRQEALITRDPAVTERASKLARFKRDAKSALELATLWYEIDPDSGQAAENLADMYARTNQPLAALSVLEESLEKGHKVNFGLLRNSQYSTDNKELEQVLARLENIADHRHNDNFSLIFTRTLLLQKNGQSEAALEQIKHLKHYETDPVQLALIEAQLLSELDRYDDAARLLNKALKKNPEEQRLQLAYARNLTKTDLPKAESKYEELLQQSPEDAQLLMSHAMIAAENKHYDASKKSLQALIDTKQKINFAHYYLGLVADQQQDKTTALTHFKQVLPGEHFLPATKHILAILAERESLTEARTYLQKLREQQPLQAPNFWVMESNLLRDKQQTELAHQVLTKAIKQFPQQGKLRIERSYLSEQLSLIHLVEEDLRFVLQRDPNNAMALNALGYILADRTSRYQEAYDLIHKANELVPNNAAILDSLGWVLFKLGDNDAALKYLNLAFEKSTDQEIAAHLIEIYWLQGDKKNARKVYKTLRKETDDHPKIDEVIQRLDITL